jgi:excisionase family DNA binding protein
MQPTSPASVGLALRDAADALDQMSEALRAAAVSASIRADDLTTAPAFLSVEGACQALGLSRATVNRRIADGTLRSRRVGGRRLIPIAAVREMAGAAER